MGARLSIEVRPGDGELTLRLRGEVDLTSVASFRQCLDVLDPEWIDIFVDLAGVTFFDSTGIHELLAIRDRCVDEGRTLTVVSPSEHVLRTLEVAGVADLLLKQQLT